MTTLSRVPVAPAVARAAAALEVLGSAAGVAVGLGELSRRLGCPKSSLANVMTELVAAGLVRRTEAGFLLGRRLAELGGAYLANVDIVQAFRAACAVLPAAGPETMQLAVLDRLEVVYIARHNGVQPIRFMVSDIGRRLPATCTALGKAALATLNNDELEAHLRDVVVLPRMTSHSLQTLDDLRDDLARVRQRGFAIDDEETTEGVICYAVAVPRVATTADVHAVSVTLLKVRVETSYIRTLVGDLGRLAAELGGL
jgi:DNA-binding IclR family transcriptional regulator